MLLDIATSAYVALVDGKDPESRARIWYLLPRMLLLAQAWHAFCLSLEIRAISGQ